jgi:shikimate dehydrogenase
MRRFGLIGHPVSHSWSQQYFQEKWEQGGIEDCRYELHDLTSVEEVIGLWNQGEWSGMNVTVPHKQSIIPLLDGLSEEARSIGAVNTISFSAEGRIGHNTDAPGFRRSIAPFLEGHHHRALVLGTGGSAAAVCHVLRDIGLEVMRVSRTPREHDMVGYPEIGAEGIKATPVIVNCTPIGMHPHIHGMPPIEGAMGGLGARHLVVDLIYNPRETRLLSLASSLGAKTLDGLAMLKHQADVAWEIWNGEAAST